MKALREQMPQDELLEIEGLATESMRDSAGTLPNPAIVRLGVRIKADEIILERYPFTPFEAWKEKHQPDNRA